MITLLSENEVEYSTELVMDWLAHYDQSFRRVNGDAFLKEEFSYQIDRQFIEQTDAKKEVVWNRRWLHFYYYDTLKQYLNPIAFYNLKVHLTNELNTLSEFWRLQFLKENTIDPKQSQKLNKLEVLAHADALGLPIPATIVTNSKADLQRFLAKHTHIITKTIADITSIDISNEKVFFMETKMVTPELVESLPDTFFPSLFQACIKKSYEIRAFYLEPDFYSLAIFSQRNEKTKVDFRNYDWENPNRTVPYQLDEALETKLRALLKRLNLRTASVDILVDETGKSHFLEVNPVGQFGMVSFPCNYYLEEKLALYLIQQHENTTTH